VNTEDAQLFLRLIRNRLDELREGLFSLTLTVEEDTEWDVLKHAERKTVILLEQRNKVAQECRYAEQESPQYEMRHSVEG